MTRTTISKVISLVIIAVLSIAFIDSTARADNASGVTYRSVVIDGVDIFYREAGDPSRPTILLLHGFPTSSHMFRDLLTELADEFHLVAPDYPGYGFSAMPTSKGSTITSGNRFGNIGRIATRLTKASIMPGGRMSKQRTTSRR